ncbi:MAG: amino acid ABC transporter substrate-binding protein, partial [Variovorax sp.]
MNFARSAWRLARRLAAAGLLASGLGVAVAQTQTDASLTGTLAKVRNASAVTIGYRESSIPFSYLSARKEPIGYSIELCK